MGTEHGRVGGGITLVHVRSFSAEPGVGREQAQLLPRLQPLSRSTSWCRTPRTPRIPHSYLVFRSSGRSSYQIRRIGHILFITLLSYTGGMQASI